MSARGRRIDIFSPIFFVSVLMSLYVLWALIQYQRDALSPEAIGFALAYLAVFGGAFATAYVTDLGTLLARRLPRVRPDFQIKTGRLFVVTLLSLPLGLALFAYIAFSTGLTSPLEILTNLLLFRGGSAAAGREYVLFLAFFMIEAPFWAWLIRRKTSAVGSVALTLYWVLILAVSVLSGARVRVYSAVMGLGFVYHCTRHSISFRRAVLVGALALIPFSLFYQAQGLVRAESTSTSTMLKAVRDVHPVESVVGLTGRLADAFDGFIRLVDNADRVHYLWGRSLVDAFYLPIPRAWVPDKPSAFNYQALQQLYPERVDPYYGEEYSIIGELFMNWHLLGVLMGGAVFGVVIKTLTRYYLAHRHNPGFVFLYRPLFLALPMAWMTSGMINTEAHSILILNVVAGSSFLWLVGGRLRRSSRAARPTRLSATPHESTYAE